MIFLFLLFCEIPGVDQRLEILCGGVITNSEGIHGRVKCKALGYPEE